MRTGRIPQLLLALVFLASQLIALVHATHHQLTGPGVDSCHLCAIADAVPVPPSTTVVSLQAAPHQAPALPTMIGLTDRRPFARPNTRGPPLHLA